tara:strand:+ start:71807 stop:72250 length:444 start_codon:yes stop_codon:yes gene_type:complete
MIKTPTKQLNPQSSILNPISPGFTLIEVLIAVAILSIGLLAVSLTTGEAIRNTNYLQGKTIAHIVAQNTIAAALSKQISTPMIGATQTGSAEMLNQNWNYKITLSDSTLNGVKMLQVKASLSGQPDVSDTVTDFVYQNAKGEVVLWR